jgi:hypothetical protein
MKAGLKFDERRSLDVEPIAPGPPRLCPGLPGTALGKDRTEFTSSETSSGIYPLADFKRADTIARDTSARPWLV